MNNTQSAAKYRRLANSTRAVQTKTKENQTKENQLQTKENQSTPHNEAFEPQLALLYLIEEYWSPFQNFIARFDIDGNLDLSPDELVSYRIIY